MSRKPYKIEWEITYEQAGESYGWVADGWSTPDSEQHRLIGTQIAPYWHDTLTEAKEDAMERLKRYTDERRFKYDNKESVTL